MTTCPPQCQKPIRKDTTFRVRIGVCQMPLNAVKSSQLTESDCPICFRSTRPKPSGLHVCSCQRRATTQ